MVRKGALIGGEISKIMRSIIDPLKVSTVDIKIKQSRVWVLNTKALSSGYEDFSNVLVSSTFKSKYLQIFLFWIRYLTFLQSLT